MALMNCRQNVTVACDFLLIPCSRHGFIENNLLQAFIRSENPFNAIGCFRTLNFCNFNKSRKSIGLGFDMNIMLTTILMDLREHPDNIRSEQLYPAFFVMEVTHVGSPTIFY